MYPNQKNSLKSPSMDEHDHVGNFIQRPRQAYTAEGDAVMRKYSGPKVVHQAPKMPKMSEFGTKIY